MMLKFVRQLGPSVFVLLALMAGYWYVSFKDIPFSAVDVIAASYAHNNNLTGKGVSIAVVDEGFDKNHSLIQNNLSHLRYNGDFNDWDVSESISYQNGKFVFASHGTHVSGIIAGEDSRIGVAPNATLIPVKMGVWGGDQSIVKSLQMAQKSPADIVNISMQLSNSGNYINPNIKQALFDLANSGKIIVIAAGNSGIPMNYSGYTRDLMDLAHDSRMQGRMIVVGATTYKDFSENLANFSNFPSKNFGLYDVSYFITAPGDDIISAVFGDKTDKMSGTSMAAPMVSGSLALLKQKYPHLAPEELVLLLLKSARTHQLGTKQHLNKARYGHGVVDVKAALTLGQELML